jgi:hypothetical protein
LFPLCIEQSFSPKQYELLVSLVNDMITQVTIEHRQALHQLYKTKQFHENMTDTLNITSSVNHFGDIVTSSTSSTSSSLGIFESNSFPIVAQNKHQSSQTRPLNLNEKHR